MSAPAATSPPPVFHFDNTLGSLLVGGLVAAVLWGVTCMQTYTFFMRGSNDLRIFKLLIAFLWVLDTFDSILNGHILYHYLVSNFANPLAIGAPVWSVILHVAITSISDFIIRSMFARRVYRLSNGNILLTVWIVAVSLTDLTCGIVITVKAFNVASFLELNSLSTLMYLNFAAGTTSDLSVALALCYYLYRSRTGFRRTDSLIKILILYTVNTGLIVALDASAGMITYVVMPHNFVFLGFYLLLSKLYLNSYLASLNAREGLRGKSDETPLSFQLSKITQTWRRSNHNTSLPTVVDSEKGSHTDRMAISIETMVDRKIDEGPQAY